MVRYRPADMSPRFLPVVLVEQLVPGTSADALHQLIDILDFMAFDIRYRNDTANHLLAPLFAVIPAKAGIEPWRPRLHRKHGIP